MLWAMHYGDAKFAMPDGDLSDVGDLRASDQVALTVATSRPTFEYLRGFVGESYSDNKWQPLGSDAVMGNRDMLYWLEKDGFAGDAQLSLASRLVGYDEGGLTTLSIVPNSVRAPYAYLPYGYADGSSAHLTTDMAQTRISKGVAQRIEYGSSITRKAYLLQDAVAGAVADDTGEAASSDEAKPEDGLANEGSGTGRDTAGASPEADLRTYLDDENAYRAFAKESYLDVPDNVRDVFGRLYGAPMQLTIEQAKVQVQYFLDGTVEYSEQPGRGSVSSKNSDFVENFLTQTRAGYSVHYATAATLLMRYYGVPARYVEGYVLNTSKLDEETDGAGRSESAAGDTYALTERQAHAWVGCLTT